MRYAAVGVPCRSFWFEEVFDVLQKSLLVLLIHDNSVSPEWQMWQVHWISVLSDLIMTNEWAQWPWPASAIWTSVSRTVMLAPCGIPNASREHVRVWLLRWRRLMTTNVCRFSSLAARQQANRTCFPAQPLCVCSQGAGNGRPRLGVA